MSTEIEDFAKSTSDDDKVQEFHKETRYAYNKGFLLSLAEINECKRLPSGFDSSNLCELYTAATTISSNSLNDSVSGGSDGIQSLDSWPNPANVLPGPNPANGLLGKRGLLRAPVCVAGWSSAQNVQSCNLLHKSITPYRPPHLYKMNNKLKDGVTFGFTDSQSGENAEVERWGKDSSEWTRKEHKNSVQENQKYISDEHKENLDPDFASILDDSRNERRLFNKGSRSDECVLSSTPSDASSYSSTPRSITSKLLPPAQGHLNKCNESEEWLVSSNSNDARPFYSMQSSIITKRLSHELMSKSPEQSFETKSNKKANQHEVTSLQLVSDEICLPDEDSLITSDDFKLPMDLVLLPESNVSETDLFAYSSRMLGNVSQMLAALNVPLEERSQSSLEVPTTSSGADNKNGLETSHGNPRAGQHFPRSPHSRTKQVSALYCPSDSQRACRNKFKPHMKNRSYNQPHINYIPVDVLPNCFLDPNAASNSFDNSFMQPLSQQILAPFEFPDQVNGFPRGPSYPQPLTINGMASYSQGPSQTQTCPLNNCHQTYRGSTMTNPAASSNQAAINNRLPEMERIANQMHPGWPWTGNVQQFGLELLQDII